MPMYEFQCLSCGKTFENFCCLNNLESFTIKQKCPSCKGKVKRLIGGFKRDWFREFISEDFDGTPITVKSKQHLKQLCKEHGVTSRAL